MTLQKSKNKKKAYHPPQVVTYGDLHRVTGLGKGGGGGPTKGGLSQDGGAGGPKSKATGMA